MVDWSLSPQEQTTVSVLSFPAIHMTVMLEHAKIVQPFIADLRKNSFRSVRA
jgi:hypothetical protein